MQSSSPSSIDRCDCCGLALSHLPAQGICPRCGYPVEPDEERHFLTRALLELQRVATYGGANMTVSGLIQRYQRRLSYLQHRLLSLPVQPIPPEGQQSLPPQAQLPAQPQEQPSQPQRRHANQRTSSLSSFFADQTINLVASLGAFLILTGSLSFVISTSNLFLSFLVVLFVHGTFGIVGAISYRFQSFRTVARIYTAIFALQVPLIGFAGYRLVVGSLLHLSAPTLVAYAAAYAAVIYAALALYQQFKPFGYLSGVALIVVVLAGAQACNVSNWWWPSILLLLALAALPVFPRQSKQSTGLAGKWDMLAEPFRLLSLFCVLLGCLGGLLTFFYYTFGLVSAGQPFGEVRFSLVCVAFLLLCWNVLFVWRTQRLKWIRGVPYTFLVCVLAVLYVGGSPEMGYLLAVTAVACLYYALACFAGRWLQPLGAIERYLERFALVLVALLPLLTAPLLPLLLLLRAARESMPQFLPQVALSSETVTEIGVLLVGCVLMGSAVVRHGWRKSAAGSSTTAWCWLLLLCGILLNWACGLIVLVVNVEPFWAFLGLTLALTCAAVTLRRLRGAEWGNPLDVLVLAEGGWTLLMAMKQTVETRIVVLLFFAALSYLVLLYQRRRLWLFIPTVLAVAALVSPGTSFWIFFLVAPLAALAALGTSRVVGQGWAVPLYVVACVAAIVGGIVASEQGQLARIASITLFIEALLAYGIVRFERRPEFLVVPMALAVQAIALAPWQLWQQMIAASVLCVLVLSAQFLWVKVTPDRFLILPKHVHGLLSLGGQCCVVLTIIGHGGLSAQTGIVAHVGVGALVVLAGLLFWYGSLWAEKAAHSWYHYGAGLLLASAASWELALLGHTRLDWLSVPIAVYLLVIAPFLTRQTAQPRLRRLGQLSSIVGAVLLLCPLLWTSFGEDTLQPTLLLAAASLALLVAGITWRVRIFVLSGAGVIVVSAMRALFLPSLGVPPFLALAILGLMLLVVATVLKVVGPRLQGL